MSIRPRFSRSQVISFFKLKNLKKIMFFYIFIDRFANVNQVYEKPLLRLHTACTSHFQITAPDVSNFNWWRWFSGDSPDSTVQSHRRPKHVTLRRLRCTWHIADSQVYIPRTSFTYGQCPLRRDLIAVLIPSHGMDFRRTWDGKRILRSH
jgi:hypothetical protein